MIRRHASALVAVWTSCLVAPIAAAELKEATARAFERYQSAAEAQIARDVASPDTSLRVMRGDAAARQRALDMMRRGEVAIERLRIEEAGNRLEIPDGLVHHWVGAVFIPGATVDAAVALLQDYDRHATVFA